MALTVQDPYHAQTANNFEVVDANLLKSFHGPGAKAWNGTRKQRTDPRMPLELIHAFPHRLAETERW